MNVSRACTAVLALLALLATAGCRQSRIVDAEDVDVCALLSAPETERIFGPAAAPAAPAARQPGFAGGCMWSFPAGDAPGTLTAYVMTQTSAANIATTPQGWFDNPTLVGELKVSLGEPTDLKGLGFVARLYGTRLFVRKGETVITLYTDRGQAAQMEQVAQALLSPKRN